MVADLAFWKTGIATKRDNSVAFQLELWLNANKETICTVPNEFEPRVIPCQSNTAENAANIAAIEAIAGRSRYRHIVAWGKFLGFTPVTVRQEVELAEAENAPLDSIQKIDGRWHTIDDIMNETNRRRVNELAADPPSRRR